MINLRFKSRSAASRRRLRRVAFAGVLALVGVAAAPPSAPVRPEYAQSWADYTAQKAHAAKPTPPDWSGIWIRDSHKVPASFDDSAGPNPEVPNLGVGRSSAKLTPAYEAAFRQKLDDLKKGVEWDRMSDCLPAGFPRMMVEPFMREFTVTPTQTWMTHEQVNETRRIYTDGRGHVEDDSPLWMGDSIGFWDGDTLVIHTDHVKAGQYQRGQPDYSFKISTVERVRKTSPTTLEDRFTVYDPDSLREPWHATILYRKQADPTLRITYDSCEENNNVYRGADGSTQYLLPNDKGYRDPATFGIPKVAQGSQPQ